MSGAGKVELKPCPFCGHEPFKRQIINDGRWAIDCQTVSCVRPGTDLTRDEAKAIAAWNTRHAEAAQLEALREAREVLEYIDRLARDRFKDGHEMGARCWLNGLVDIERAARQAHASLTAAITRISADGE